MKNLFSINIFALLFSITLGIMLISCHQPTEPVNELKPGRRDYVWTVDSLYLPFDYFVRFWASDVDDIWACSFGSLRRFNGSTWTLQKGPWPFGPNCVFGFSRNDVWAAGDGRIWHFNGSSWSLSAQIPQCVFQDIWGSHWDDIYITGFRDLPSKTHESVLVYYDGEHWTEILPALPRYNFHRARKLGNEVFIDCTYKDSTTGVYTEKILSYSNQKYREITYTNYDIQISNIGEKIFVELRGVPYEYVGGSLNPVLWTKDSAYVGGIWGNNSKNIFCVVKHGIGHFNGVNLMTIYLSKFDLSNVIWGCEAFSDAVVLIGNDFSKGYSYVFRGMLQNKL